MYYRYEARKNGKYVGIFAAFNPSQRRYFARFLKEPKWYRNNPGVDSRCWFTEEGYQKYHHVIDKMVEEQGNIEVRLLKEESLSHIVVHGKIQCIQLKTEEQG